MTVTKRTVAVAALTASLAIGYEGTKFTAYYDVGGVPTVCMGETHNVVVSKRYTLTECKAMLNETMLKVVQAVETCAPGATDNQLIAFSDLAYNAGEGVICNPSKSTLAKKVRAKDYVGACYELRKWNKARVFGVMQPVRGLTRRRMEEERICLGA